MLKVFASDFDGTLYFQHRDIKMSEESIRKIKEFQEAGHIFGMCTGRPLGGIIPFLEGDIRPDFYICSSGSNIVDGDLNEIQRRSIDRDTAKAICKQYLAQNCQIMVCVDEAFYVFHHTDIPLDLRMLSNEEELPEGRIYQVSIHAETPEAASVIAAHINEIHGDKAAAFQNVIDIDIAPNGCSKGKGMEVVRRYFEEKMQGRGQEHRKVILYGIGDSFNDLPLIEAADVSYTFPYAPEEAQAKATKVVETIADALTDALTDESEK